MSGRFAVVDSTNYCTTDPAAGHHRQRSLRRSVARIMERRVRCGEDLSFARGTFVDTRGGDLSDSDATS